MQRFDRITFNARWICRVYIYPRGYFIRPATPRLIIKWPWEAKGTNNYLCQKWLLQLFKLNIEKIFLSVAKTIRIYSFFLIDFHIRIGLYWFSNGFPHFLEEFVFSLLFLYFIIHIFGLIPHHFAMGYFSFETLLKKLIRRVGLQVSWLFLMCLIFGLDANFSKDRETTIVP